MKSLDSNPGDEPKQPAIGGGDGGGSGAGDPSGEREKPQTDAVLAAGQVCTGLTASWCPVHGDCSCPDRETVGDLDSESCPLHSSASTHAEKLKGGDASEARRQRRELPIRVAQAGPDSTSAPAAALHPPSVWALAMAAKAVGL